MGKFSQRQGRPAYVRINRPQTQGTENQKVFAGSAALSPNRLACVKSFQQCGSPRSQPETSKLPIVEGRQDKEANFGAGLFPFPLRRHPCLSSPPHVTHRLRPEGRRPWFVTGSSHALATIIFASQSQVRDLAGDGDILRSLNGKRWRLTMSNAGELNIGRAKGVVVKKLVAAFAGWIEARIIELPLPSRR